MSRMGMPPDDDSSVASTLTLEKDISVLNLHITKGNSPNMSSSDAASTLSSSGSSSNDTDSECLGSEFNKLPSPSDCLQSLPSKIRLDVPGSFAALRLDSNEPRDLDNEACLTDWDGESSIDEPNGSFVASTCTAGRSDLAPEDSISVRSLSQGTFETESDYEQSGSDTVYIEKPKKPKYEDRLTRLGYVERLPDLDGVRHYRLELSVDKLIEENTIRTVLRTFKLSDSNLVIINRDGLQPKLASDLGTFFYSPQLVIFHLLIHGSLDNFNNGFFEVKKSAISGYGAFAVRDLDPYTPILVERELFNANSFDLYNKLDTLTEEQKKAFHRLHGHKRTPSEDVRAAIWHTNSFSVSPGGSLFLVASRFNHACKERNNVEYSYDYDKKCMAFVTKEKVSAGSELFIRYSNDPNHLFATWGFCCACGGCKGISEDDCKAIGPFPWGETKSSGWQ
ncbi:hypothetical protein HD806DRAFT_533963 [Xylariaceae sp. AK1471]|nr:hypothetical protein HD806DRAFT_533963 [Xylariaceae sp. AK1471]